MLSVAYRVALGFGCCFGGFGLILVHEITQKNRESPKPNGTSVLNLAPCRQHEFCNARSQCGIRRISPGGTNKIRLYSVQWGKELRNEGRGR